MKKEKIEDSGLQRGKCERCEAEGRIGDFYIYYYGKSGKSYKSIGTDTNTGAYGSVIVTPYQIKGSEQVFVCRKCIMRTHSGLKVGVLSLILLSFTLIFGCSWLAITAKDITDTVGKILWPVVSIIGVIAGLTIAGFSVVWTKDWLQKANAYANDPDSLTKKDLESIKKTYALQGPKVAKSVGRLKPSMQEYDSFFTPEEFNGLKASGALTY